MQKKPKILVVGSFVMDLIVSTERFPGSGETVLGMGFETATGGKGANQAVQAARLGADVTMLGKVGQDDFGTQLIQSAAQAGIHVEHVLRTADAPSAIGNVQLEKRDGQTANRIIVVSGANMYITPEDVAFLRDFIKHYDMVILQQEIPMKINEIVARYAYEQNVPVMLNSAPYAPISAELLGCLSYISPNEHEAAQIVGQAVQTDADIEKALDMLMQLGVRNALITLGGRGVAYKDKSGMCIVPAVKGVVVQDPTAAGDSFVGAFCVAVCSGLSARDALVFANHAAAFTVSKMGAQPSLPMLKDVLDNMRLSGIDLSIYKALQD